MDGGFFISRKDWSETVEISPTQPMRVFSNIQIRNTLQEYDFVCTEYVSIAKAIRILTGQSCPSNLSIRPCDIHEFTMSLSNEVRAGSTDHVVLTNVASRLILPDEGFLAPLKGWEVACILCPPMTLIVDRPFHMQIGDIRAILAQHPQLQNTDWNCLNLCGMTLSDDCEAPSFVFACEFPDKVKLNLLSWNNIRFHECSQSFQTLANMHEIHDLMIFLQAKGILQGIQSLGWDFVVSLDFTSNDRKRMLTLLPQPGFLPALPDMIRRFIQARVFAGLLTEMCAMPPFKEGYQIENVAIKLWDLYVWKGFVNSALKGQTILDLWDIACGLVNQPIELRIVIDGKNFNPDCEIAEAVTITTNVIKIHLITSLHGGGTSSSGNGSDSMSEVEISSDSPPLMSNSSEVETGEIRDFPCHEIIRMDDEDSDKLICTILAFVMNLPIQDRRCNVDMFRALTLQELDIGVFFQTSVADIITILKFFKHSGIERALRRVGWMSVMEFVEFGSDPITRLLIIPIPPGNDGTMLYCSRDTLKAILMTTLHALSMPPSSNLRASVFIKVKAWGVVIFQGWMDGYTTVSIFTRSWEVISGCIESPSQLRAVCRGRSINPDRQILEYAHHNEQDELYADIHLVPQMHGGGPGKPKTEDIVKNKNAIASYLLERGADLQQTSLFAEKLVTSAGGQAIFHVMSIREDGAKMNALEKLAKTLNLSVPDIRHAHAQKNKTVNKKVKEQQFHTRTLCASDFRFKSGFFQNQDGTSCKQIDAIQAGCSGVCMMSPQDAIPWVQGDKTLSEDELAILVLGHCPSSDKAGCKKVITPAFDQHDKPVLLSSCLHNLGKQEIKIQEQSKAADIAVSSTVGCALTIYEDEVDDCIWTKVINTPVKICFDMMQQAGVSLTLPCAPWGRSWRNEKGKCPPQLADSFQVHIRLPIDKKEALMKISGISKVYVTPKSEGHLVDEDYSIIWLDKNLGDLKVIAASCQNHFGLIKVAKSNGKKINRGIRFHKDKFKEMHEQHKPGVTVPLQLVCVHFAKLAPTPIGATHDQVQEWLKEIAWKAKPVKPLGSSAWMIGAPEKFEATWASWNNQSLLLTWFPPKNLQEQKVVVAGGVKPKSNSHETVGSSQVPRLEVDPWAAYVHQNGRKLDSERNGDDGKSGTSGPRITTGPIEDRFAKQDQQIDSLKSSLQAMSNRLDLHEKKQDSFQKDIKSDIAKVKTDMTTQCQVMTSSFEETLNRSLRRQDQQLGDAFTELKALILGKAVPAKKAKTSKPDEEL